MGTSREVLEDCGIEGPDVDEAVELNKLRGPLPRPSKAVIGGVSVLGGLATIVSGCAPSCSPAHQEVQPAQMNSASQSFATAETTQNPEVAQEKPGIYITTFAPDDRPAELVQMVDVAASSIVQVINVKAIDPKDVKNTADFYSVKTEDGKEYIAFKDGDGKYVVLQGYKTGAAVDLKTGEIFVDYYETETVRGKTRTFFSLGLNRAINRRPGETDQGYKSRTTAQLQDPQYQQGIRDDLDAAGQIESVTIANPLTGQKVFFDLAKNPDFAAQILAALSPQTAYAAELPPTQVPTEEPTKEPTQTPAAEKPTSLTAENVGRRTVKVSNETFQRLSIKQPESFAFPAISDEPDFEVKYDSSETDSMSTKGDYNKIEINGSDVSLFSPINGRITFYYDDEDKPDKVTSISISKALTNKTGIVIRISSFTDSQLTADISPLLENLEEKQGIMGKELHGQTKLGQLLAKIDGKAVLSIAVVEKLDKPIEAKMSDGAIQTFSTYSTYVTPDMLDDTANTLHKWILSDEGTIAIPQN